MDELRFSKFLSLILRHKPEKIGIKLDKFGYADIDELIQKTNQSNITRELLEKIVREDTKKRYKILGNKIRASQGHSIPVELELEEKMPLDILYHGTAEKYVSLIKKSGLRKMNRNHVHLSSDIQTAEKVGKRHGELVIYQIDAKKMHDDGYVFYLSENKVWLTDKVPIQYMTKLN